MKSTIYSRFGIALLLLVAAVPAMAQGEPRRGKQDSAQHQGRRGDFRGGPGMGLRRGPKGELGFLWKGIGDLNGKNALSKKQAVKITGLVKPWSKKPVLTEENAKALLQSLKDSLTVAQKKEIGERPSFGRRPGGFGGPPEGMRPDGPPHGPPPGFGDGPEGREDGERGPGGRRGEEGRPYGRDDHNGPSGPPSEAERKAMKSFFDNYNPFFAPTGYQNWSKLPSRLQTDLTRRYKDHQFILEAVSRASKR